MHVENGAGRRVAARVIIGLYKRLLVDTAALEIIADISVIRIGRALALQLSASFLRRGGWVWLR